MKTQSDTSSRHLRPVVITLAATLVVLGAFAFWQGKPLYHWVQLQRALRQLDGVEKALREYDVSLAYSKVAQAYRLAPNEPRIIRAAARVTMAAESPRALPLLERLVQLGEATFEDRRDLALVHLLAGNRTQAGELCEQLLAEEPEDLPLLEIAMDVRLANEEFTGAMDAANKLLQLDSGNLDNRLRVAFVGLKQGNEAETALAKQYLTMVARGKDENGLKALSLLLKVPTEPALQREIIEIVADHPLANEALTLEALSFSLNLEPYNREAILENAMNERRDWPPHELAPFAAWLARHGESEFILENFDLETVLRAQTLIGPYLDALAGQERYDEIEEILGRPGLPVSPVMQGAYLGVCAQLGRKDLDKARDHLRLALIAIERFGSYSDAATIGQTGELLGHLDIAESAYELSLRSDTDIIVNHGYSRLLEIAEKERDTRKIRDAATRFSRRYPYQQNVLERLLYLNPLLGIEIESTLEKTLAMIEEEPTRAAPRVIAALAYFRMHDYASAAAICEPCDPRKLSPAYQAVYAAVAAATDRPEIAREIGAAIETAELLDEEKLLLAPVLSPAES